MIAVLVTLSQALGMLGVYLYYGRGRFWLGMAAEVAGIAINVGLLVGAP